MTKSIIRRATNRILHILARFLPGSESLRLSIHRFRGVRIDGKAFIGDDVYIENEYPEFVEIHEGAVIGLRATIIAHAGEPGKVVIERNAFVGPCSVIVSAPGSTLTIGEGSVVQTSSLVTKSVPRGVLVGGNPATVLAKVTTPMTMETTYSEFVKGLRVL